MNVSADFQSFIAHHQLFTHNDHLLLAVSGGIDSCVLVHLVAQAGYSFSIAHCNFQLRGPESDADEQLVAQLAASYGVPFFCRRFDTAAAAAASRSSIQETARELRYSWFKELLVEVAAQQISAARVLLLTAHHADDNSETVLMHFLRGTGLHGLTGIPVRNELIRRPLLGYTKEQLRTYAAAHQLLYREDASNATSAYTRNFFRNEVIPLIEQAYPQVLHNLQENIRRFTEVEQLYRLATGNLLRKLCRYKGNEVHIPVKQLLAYNNRALVYELIHPFGFTEGQVTELLKLCTASSGSFITAAQQPYRIIRHRHWLVIAPLAVTETHHAVFEKPGVYTGPWGVLQLQEEEVPGAISPAAELALLDAATVSFPLLMRRWKQGDYFYPLGMRKKKKLARFFIDQKLSATAKEQVWVLESAGKIVWVVGYRIDDRFKLTQSSSACLKIELRTQ